MRERISLRPATEADMEQVWLWANEPEVREASFHSAPILWEDHQAWFRERMNDPASRIYMVLEAGKIPVGVVRFQGSGDPLEALVSVTIASEHRRAGIGTMALGLATRRVSREYGFRRFTACIKDQNEASLRAFGKAGFRKKGTQVYAGQLAHKLVLEMRSPASPRMKREGNSPRGEV